MKKAFIITSVIDIDNNSPLTYSNVRSVFSKDERLRQTIFTITSLDLVSDKDTTIFLVDLSDTEDTHLSMLNYQKNLVYIHVKKEFPEILNVCRTHKNKSHAECLLLATFMKKYKDVLSKFDYLFKISGRYFFDKSFNLSLFDQQNKDKLFFKQPLKWTWNDNWNYQLVDQRSIQQDNFLYQYSTVLFGWGSDNYDLMNNLFYQMAKVLNEQLHYDIETLIHFFTRPYKDRLIETDWIVYGWNSTNGVFLRY